MTEIQHDRVFTDTHSAYSVGASGVEPLPKRHARDHDVQQDMEEIVRLATAAIVLLDRGW